MKKIIFVFVLFANISAIQTLSAQTTQYQVNENEIHSGHITEKIWLNEYAMPRVSISAITYTTNVALPKGAKLSDPTKFNVVIGMERKRPFAVVHIPAYVQGSAPGMVNRVSGFELTIEEQQNARNTNSAAKTTDITNSVLGQGTWYKIGITKTGFYKIDYNFISGMGISPASVNPANIRIVGNGGHLLSEANSVARPSDLLENAILVNSSGSTFGTGDYAVFYGIGTQEWTKDSVHQRFYHQNNYYTDTAYYFISFDQGAGLRISEQGAPPTGNVNVTDFNYYDAHELDLVDPAGIGKLWYGEEFAVQLSNANQTFSFDMGAIVPSVYCRVFFAGTCDASGSLFSASVNGTSIGTASLGITPPNSDNVMSLASVNGNVTCNTQTINVGVTYYPSDASGLGWLYFIELNARRPLTITGDQLNFRDWQSAGAGKIANYQLQGANSNTKVWDVTNPQTPVIMNGTLSSSTYSFAQDAAMLHEFAAMNSTNLFAPKYIGKVANQNLHATGQVDLIIVTHPEFLDEAQQLADYHKNHDNMRVVVATTDQVYNEFSSGAQDVSAIRDFARMFYKRATDSTQMPRYLTLFGGASYDYKNRLPNNSNFVPVYESAEALNNISGFSTDDFFGFLDDNENINNPGIANALDIGIGRLPARTKADAAAMVNKIINYTSPVTLGPWRIATLFVADNADGAGDHLDNADTMAAAVTAASNNLYNEDKRYIDATPTVSTPAGARCPDMNAGIDNDVYKGIFLINYNGHGNTEVWADERILTQDDYNNWNNMNMLPFMVTATCDFGQFDHPQFVSAAEQMVLKSGGGVITILTTTAAVYADYNVYVNQQYLTSQFVRNANGRWNTFGDAERIGKNITYFSVDSTNSDELVNFRKFALLGDPALTPDFPQYSISLDSINDGITLKRTDTIKALGAYTIYGRVNDNDGNELTNFNGLLSVSIFDKPTVITTITGTNEKYKLQNNIIYKGRVSVNNGRFKFSFITPRDINYNYGTGKISTYAQTTVTDAAGADTSITIGGFSDYPVLSTASPVVKAYIGDSLFLNGGITGSNTSLFVALYDSTGINVSGNSVGHDLTAVLDDNVETPYILNDYYETAPDTYQRGYVSFPINGLSDGAHTITVKAWDVNDNVGEGSVNFVVVDGKVVDIQNLMNYPNPFSGSTHFVFEHNHPEEQLDVKINIYNTSGGLVKSIQQTFTPTGSRSNEITWDGTGSDGARLPSGVYVYRLNISTDKGFQSSAYQKLVIVR